MPKQQRFNYKAVASIAITFAVLLGILVIGSAGISNAYIICRNCGTSGGSAGTPIPLQSAQLTVTPTAIDYGQSVYAVVTWVGGTAPYTATFFYGSSYSSCNTPSTIYVDNLTIGDDYSNYTYAYLTPPQEYVTSSEYLCAKVVDSKGNTSITASPVVIYVDYSVNPYQLNISDLPNSQDYSTILVTYSQKQTRTYIANSVAISSENTIMVAESNVIYNNTKSSFSTVLSQIEQQYGTYSTFSPLGMGSQTIGVNGMIGGDPSAAVVFAVSNTLYGYVLTTELPGSSAVASNTVTLTQKLYRQILAYPGTQS